MTQPEIIHRTSTARAISANRGKSIVTGLPTDQPTGSFVRVVREDDRKPGLLFAATETSVYVSFDDGDHWQSLRLNLPTTSFYDLKIHDGDLIAATYGRGIWILDDISPLEQLTAEPCGSASAFVPPSSRNPGSVEHQPGHAVSA